MITAPLLFHDGAAERVHRVSIAEVVPEQSASEEKMWSNNNEDSLRSECQYFTPYKKLRRQHAWPTRSPESD
jgi:hypothetical protein